MGSGIVPEEQSISTADEVESSDEQSLKDGSIDQDRISGESSIHSHPPSSAQESPQDEFIGSPLVGHSHGGCEAGSSISGLGESKQTQLSNEGTKYFQTFLTDAYSLKSAQPESADIYALQNIFRLISDRLHQWIKCSEQEYQMTLPVDCWNGCGYKTKFEEMTSHVRMACSHKPVICGDCSEVHPAYHMKDHLTKECVKRLVACPNSKIGCKELIPFYYLTTHIKLRCQYRLAYCRLHCSLQIPLILRTDHELNHCKKRKIPCYLCSELIPSEELSVHMKDKCLCRKIQCTKGCHEYFNLKDIEYHENHECIQECKWKCGEKIGPVQKRNLHELTVCLNRSVECSRKCGIVGLTARNQLDHERNYCQFSTLVCPNNCGEVLLRTHLYKHLDPWHGTCPERMVRCPSNLIGWRVLVNNADEGIVMQYRRMDLSAITASHQIPLSPQNNSTFSLCGDSYGHITTDLSAIPSSDCGKYSWCSNGVDMILIRFPDRHVWTPYWTSNIIPMRVQIKGLKSTNSSDGYYECGWICYSQLNTHLQSHCCNRDVLLGQANPLTELTYSLSNSGVNHHDETDTNSIQSRITTGTGGQGDSISRRPPEQLDFPDDIETPHGTEQLMKSLTSFPGQHTRLKDSIPLALKRHEINEFLVAPPDKVTCEFCSTQLDCDKLEWHLKHDCTHIPIRCQYGCGLKIPRRVLQHHLDNVCCKRNIVCDKCQEIMWADELEEHLEKTCASRLIPCPNNCRAFRSDGTPEEGPMMIIARDLPSHLDHYCENRIHHCECGEKYLFCQRSDHLITTCPKKLTLCPQGCGLEIPRDETESHMEHYCVNKHLFQNKLIICPLKCGIRLKRLDVLEHVSYHCVMRLVECPLHCGNTLRKEKLTNHLKICPNRELYCEKGMPTCQFKLHQWFCCDCDDGKNSRVPMTPGGKRKTAQNINENEDRELDDYQPDDASEDIEEQEDGCVKREMSRGPDTIQAIKGQRFYGSGRLIPVENYASAAHNASIRQNKSNKLPSPSQDTYDNLGSIDSHTYSLANVSTSVMIQDGKLLMKENLRLLACPSHGRNLLLYAVRFDELELLKYIIHKTGGDDLDLQDRYGDTPLTLACRLQKVEYVKLLIHYGADVNLETVTGKTPLIEATKINNKEIVEILITAGAIVQQKTFKHSKSALDWAKILKLDDIALYLDLGSTVQIQIEEIFYAISLGDLKKVTKIVEDGVSFTPNNMKLFQDRMEEAMQSLKDTKDALLVQTEKVKSIEIKWKELKDIYEKDQMEEDISKERYQKLYQDVNNVHLKVGSRFEIFDKRVALVSSYDLEEIANMRNPKHSTRIASLAYGILFSILDENYPNSNRSATGYDQYKTDIQSSKVWWPKIIRSLLNTQETLKRLQTFSWVSLQSPHLRSLGLKIRELFHEILVVKKMEEEEDSTSSHVSVNPLTTAAIIHPASTAAPIATSTDEFPEGKEEGTGTNIVLNQEDWDSDADDGGDGEWVKGEWIGKVKKKSRWWELKAEIQDGNAKIEGDEDLKTQGQLSGYKKKRNRDIIRISEELSELEEKLHSSNSQKNDPSHRHSEHQPLQTIVDSSSSSRPVPSFTLNLPFVDCMIILMSAVSEMITDLTALSSLNLQVKELKIIYDEKKSNKEISKQKYETINSKYLMFQNEINLLIKKVTTNTNLIKNFKEKLRITRLLNHATSSGHTVISWAACNGCYEIVEILLSKGSTVGYNEELLHMSATVIQITFQIFYYHSNYSKQKQLQKRQELLEGAISSTTSGGSPTKVSAAELMNLEENQDTTLGHGVEEIFHLKEKRNLLIFRINRLRRNFRFPVPEAAYCGHSDIVQRIYERRLLHMNFIDSWIYPSPPPPRKRLHYRLSLNSKKHSFQQIIKDSKSHFSSGILTPHGWLERFSPQDPFVESCDELKLLYSQFQDRIHSYREKRHLIHMLHLNKLSQLSNQKKMTLAIKTGNFYECVRLSCKEDLCSIDFETADGLTALIVAAEENISGLHHHYILNDDMKPVLAVNYLLDRLERAPGVNIETSTGNTALLHACALGREYVVEALLDRHANINQQNKYGQAALHIAAINGSVRCTKLLLERGASSDMKDMNGKTPYDLALEHGFSGILTILGQYRGGYYGEITGKRGTINETIGCPSGCGVILHRHEIKDHLLECSLRTIPCPLHCSDPNIIARDVELHVTNDCPHRLLECSKCHQMIQACEMNKHDEKKCPHRSILCSLGCGTFVEAKDLVDHQKTCLYKIIQCPELCGESYPVIKRLIHMRQECINRRVVCPNKCQNMVTYHALNHHLSCICPRRLMTCQWCSDSQIEYQHLAQHELHCSFRLTECENRCNEKVQLIHMKDHLENSCLLRFVPCPNSCGLKIRAKDMQIHLENECGNRMILCPSGCMYVCSGVAEERTQLLAKQLTIHLRTECSERIVPCGLCSLQMKAKELNYHSRQQCEYRSCSCRNHGCSKVLPFNLREKHERHECKYRFVLCPTGCGTAIIAKKLQHHLNTSCGMKYIPCTLGCGLEIRQGQIGMHLQYECKLRPLRSQTMRFPPSSPSASPLPSLSNSVASRGNGIGRSSEMSPGRSLSRGSSKTSVSHDTLSSIGSPMSTNRRENNSSLSPVSSPARKEGTGESGGGIPTSLNPVNGTSSRRTVSDLEGKKKSKKADSFRSLPPL